MMQAEGLLNNLQSSGVHLFAENGKLKIDAPKGRITPEIKEMLRAHKAEIIRKLNQRNSDKLFDKLNLLIERGISFDVAVDHFQICGDELLSEQERDFTDANRPEILCHLHQSLLTKELFDFSQKHLEIFKFDVLEREAVVAQCEPDPEKISFEAIADVSKRWFTELLAGRYEQTKEEALAIAA